MSQAVVYLARGLGHGIGASRAFFESYARHPAGYPHDLIIIAKGWDQVPGRAELDQLALQHNATVFDLPDDGFDWGAYMRVAPKLTHEWVCFLNTHSQILADDWLKSLHAAAVRPGVGAAGATGTWGTLLPVFQNLWPTVVDLRYRSGAIYAFFAFFWIYGAQLPYDFTRHVLYFPFFPNPHLRSNAFNIRLSDFLQFIETKEPPRSKWDAYRLECGRSSLTRHLHLKGLDSLVAGKFETYFIHGDWEKSETFRFPGQKNLLVGDNQTRIYETATPISKRILERSSWGRPITMIACKAQDIGGKRRTKS